MPDLAVYDPLAWRSGFREHKTQKTTHNAQSTKYKVRGPFASVEAMAVSKCGTSYTSLFKLHQHSVFDFISMYLGYGNLISPLAISDSTATTVVPA